jgi:predicted nucleotidyltransferase
MRLKPNEIEAIKTAAADVFGPGVVVRLFGSRVRDDLKGGDIDLHLEVEDGFQDYRHAGDFRWKLMNSIGERAIDLVFHVRGRPLRSIDHVAMNEGVAL